jgi:hypothetical protein
LDKWMLPLCLFIHSHRTAQHIEQHSTTQQASFKACRLKHVVSCSS